MNIKNSLTILPVVLTSVTIHAGIPVKPNVIIVLTDDLGYGTLSCYTNKDFSTPNIDKFSKSGTIFTQAYCAASVSTPSRYGLLTGRYPWRTFLKNNVISDTPSLIEPDRFTLPKLFQSQGYATACIGKWHLGFNTGSRESEINYNEPTTIGPNELGFDYFFGLPVGHFYPPLVFMENHNVVGLDKNDPISVNKTKVKANKPVTEGGKSALFNPETVEETLFAKSGEFIRAKAIEKKPFFLYLGATIPHDPYIVNPAYKNSGPCGVYGDVIRELDDRFGKLIALLDELKLRDNTIVIFTSDNGGVPPDTPYLIKEGIHFDPNTPLRGNKGTGWEGGLRIPFIISYPKVVKAGVKNNTPICNTDLMASFASLFNYNLPDDAGEDSFNALPTLLYNQKLPQHPFVLQSRGGVLNLHYGDWKFIPVSGNGDNRTKETIKYDTDQPIQLYKISKDICEKENIHISNASKVKEMEGLIDEIKNSSSRKVWEKMGIKQK